MKNTNTQANLLPCKDDVVVKMRHSFSFYNKAQSYVQEIFSMVYAAHRFGLYELQEYLHSKAVNPVCHAFGQATYNADLYFSALSLCLLHLCGTN